jgi:hypothetical protein
LQRKELRTRPAPPQTRRTARRYSCSWDLSFLCRHILGPIIGHSHRETGSTDYAAKWGLSSEVQYSCFGTHPAVPSSGPGPARRHQLLRAPETEGRMRTCAVITKSGMATWCCAARRRCCFRDRLQARALSSDALVLADHGSAGDVEGAKAQFEMRVAASRRLSRLLEPRDQVSDLGLVCVIPAFGMLGIWHTSARRTRPVVVHCVQHAKPRSRRVFTNTNSIEPAGPRVALAARLRSILRKFRARFSLVIPFS